MVLVKTLRRTIYETFEKIRYIFCILLVMFVIFSVIPVVHGFAPIAAKQEALDLMDLLIKKVHEPKWIIGYHYSAECQPADRENSNELEAAIAAALRLWLKPLRDLQPQYQIVDNFQFQLQRDYTGQGDKHSHVYENIAELRTVDLRVTFQCMMEKKSFAVISLAVSPEIFIRQGTQITTTLSYHLFHEIGHAFGLGDTYLGRNYAGRVTNASSGGFTHTVGQQPDSVMSTFSYFSLLDENVLSEDDKRGMVWLYQYYYQNIAREDCFFSDYVWEQETAGCRPKYPLIFETKYSPSRLVLQLLAEDKTIDINAQDAEAMTALHYAVMTEKEEVVKALLAYPEIKLDLKDKQGRTPLDIALAVGNTAIIKMLPEPPRRKEDVNGDGVVNINDLVQVAQSLNADVSTNPEVDVNGDGTINILDLIFVAQKFGELNAAAPTFIAMDSAELTPAIVQAWIKKAQVVNDGSIAFRQGITNLQRLLETIAVPEKTVLLVNYPNPFNPETWIPYQLAKSASVNVSIYAADGKLIRTLTLGHQVAGVYHARNRAVHWDGKNSLGESVASGVYFYTLTAGDFFATRRMLILK